MSIQQIKSGVIADDAVTAAKIGSLPAGSVLQVVQVPAPSSVTISSGQATPTSWQSLLSASITPTSTTSKIYIFWSAGYSMISGNTWSGCGFAIFRGSVGSNQIGSVYGLIGYDTSASLNHRINQCAGMTVDTPGSIASVTYHLGGRAENGNAQVSASTSFSNYSPSLITLFEVAV